MNEHKKSCWDTKNENSSVPRNDFLQDSIKFQFSTDVKWYEQKKGRPYGVQQWSQHYSFIRQKCSYCSLKQRPRHSVVGKQFCSFLYAQRPTFKDLFIIVREIKRCKCSLITFFAPAWFVRFHRFLRTRKFHSRMSKFILIFLDRNVKIITSLLQQ